MSLFRPYFRLDAFEGEQKITHNCNGSIGFAATAVVTEDTARLINMALEEGKRRKASEMRETLGLHE